MSRLFVTTGLPILGLLLSGCALLPVGKPHQPRIQPAVTAMIRAQQHSAPSELTLLEHKPDSADDRLRKGDALRRDGAYAEAMWLYLQAYEMDRGAGEATARMASLHLMVEPERAELIFRELVVSHPHSGAAHTGLGLSQIARQDWLAATETLTRAVGISSRPAAAYSALGVALDRLGRHAEARQAFGRATALEPRYYEAFNNLGVSYLTTEEFSAAASALRMASRVQSRDPAVLNNLGLALGRMLKYDAALAAFRRAGSEQAARNNLGYVRFLNGDYELAVAEYEQALTAGGPQGLLVLRNIRAARSAAR